MGVDVSDVETVTDEHGEEHVVFVSSYASLGGYSSGDFPALGFISKIEGAWRLNHARRRWLDQIAGSSREAALACPGGDCGGFSEIAFLRASKRLAVGVYFQAQQGLLVMDLDGVVLASHRIPRPGNRCTADPTDTVPWIGVRQVEVDPTSVLGDERLAISTDGTLPMGHLVQELRYDDVSRTLVPASDMVMTGSPSVPRRDCTTQGQNATYDHLGNLVVGAFADGHATYDVYLRDPVTGRRSLETDCPFRGHTEDGLGRRCVADLSLGDVAGVDRALGALALPVAGSEHVGRR